MRPVVSQVADAHKSNRFASRMVWKRAETAAGEETRAMPLANSCLCEAAVSLHARHRLVLRIWTRDRRTRYEHVNNDSLQFWNGRGHETPPCLGITRHTSWRSITTCNHHCSRELNVHRRYGCDRIFISSRHTRRIRATRLWPFNGLHVSIPVFHETCATGPLVIRCLSGSPAVCYEPLGFDCAQVEAPILQIVAA